VAGQTVLGLELLGEVQGVVDEGEARGAAATEVGAESEGEDHIGGDLVHGGQLLADLGLVHRRQSRVQDIADHLFPGEQAVGHELAGADGGGCTGHFDGAAIRWSEIRLGLLFTQNSCHCILFLSPPSGST